MSKHYHKNAEISEQTGDLIIKAYAQDRNLKRVWSKFCYRGHGYEQIRLYLKEKGKLQRAKWDREETFDPDVDHRRIFTAETLNLEEEIKTRIYR